VAALVVGGCELVAGIEDRVLSGGAGGIGEGAGAAGAGGGDTGGAGAGGAGGAPLAASCSELHTIDPLLPSGVYSIQIDPANGVPFELSVYCDMQTDDGGWTLAAVCRPEEPFCWVEGAVGRLTDPTTETTAKLSDENIRTLLRNGEKLTRGWWRQETRFGGNYPPQSLAVFNQLDDPSFWTSADCYVSDPPKSFSVKHAEVDDAEADMIALSDAAYGLSFGPTLLTGADACNCGSNGWSNLGPSSCQFGVWAASCELGPSLSHDCVNNLQEERADLIVWVR
jgi:hypothetical protein